MTIHSSGHVLIVDDSVAVRSVVRMLLTQMGFKDVDDASDGEVALTKISENHYDLVISDWNMQPMDGQTLLEQVRANEKHANLPFIMMTAESDIGKLITAKHAGVSGFINKPFNADALKAKISQINAKQRTRQ